MCDVNMQYKDRLFRLIFGSEEYKQNALDLYNAVNNTSYTDLEDLEFNTIDDAIYMKMKNDVSFILGSEINLYEHQSSYNPNMPVRGLMYLSKKFDEIIKTKRYNVYGTRQIFLPTPRYVVFYNGTKEMEDRTTLRLSDAFQGKDGCVEMTAIMLNINAGHNKEILEKCKVLGEYASFVAKVRQLRLEMEVDDAVKGAVDFCIQEGILQSVLLRHKSEVVDMCITEYNEIETMDAFKEEGRAEGRIEGRAEGRAEGRIEGQSLLVSVIQRLKNGETPDSIRESGIDEDTVALALTCF